MRRTNRITQQQQDSKIQQIQQVLPKVSPEQCQQALRKNDNNVESAIVWLLEMEEQGGTVSSLFQEQNRPQQQQLTRSPNQGRRRGNEQIVTDAVIVQEPRQRIIDVRCGGVVRGIFFANFQISGQQISGQQIFLYTKITHTHTF